MKKTRVQKSHATVPLKEHKAMTMTWGRFFPELAEAKSGVQEVGLEAGEEGPLPPLAVQQEPDQLHAVRAVGPAGRANISTRVTN